MRALRVCFHLSLQCVGEKFGHFGSFFFSIDRVFLFQHCAFIGKRTCWALATFYNFTSLVDALVTRRQYSGALLKIIMIFILLLFLPCHRQGCISCLTCSYPELTEDHVLTSAYVKIFRTVTRNALDKSVWRKKDCFWLPLNKHAMNIWLSSLRIRARLNWRTGKHLHVLHVLQTYSTCSHPRW